MVPDDDAPLTLSEEALKRVYVPGGTLKHHHACQFLSFRVPRASPMDPYMVGHHRAIQQHSYHGKPARSKDGFLGMSSLLGASSFDDTSSQLSNPSDVMLLAHSTSEGAFIKASSSSSFATPPRAIRAQQQSPPYGRPSQPQQSMILNTASFRKWGAQASPPLATVGEAGNNTMKENPTETASLKDPSLTKKPKESRNKKRSLLVKWMGLMSCLIGRHKVGGSEKSRDGYSSSWGGDGSKSSDAKIQLTNTGRDTPDSDTSKGSAEAGEAEDTFFVDSSIEVGSGGLIQNTNWARFGDDPSVVTPSVVSDSAPLLTNFSRNSSSSVVN